MKNCQHSDVVFYHLTTNQTYCAECATDEHQSEMISIVKHDRLQKGVIEDALMQKIIKNIAQKAENVDSQDKGVSECSQIANTILTNSKLALEHNNLLWHITSNIRKGKYDCDNIQTKFQKLRESVEGLISVEELRELEYANSLHEFCASNNIVESTRILLGRRDLVSHMLFQDRGGDTPNNIMQNITNNISKEYSCKPRIEEKLFVVARPEFAAAHIAAYENSRQNNESHLRAVLVFMLNHNLSCKQSLYSPQHSRYFYNGKLGDVNFDYGFQTQQRSELDIIESDGVILLSKFKDRMFITVKHDIQGAEKITKYVINKIAINGVERAALRMFEINSPQENISFDNAMQENQNVDKVSRATCALVGSLCENPFVTDKTNIWNSHYSPTLKQNVYGCYASFEQQSNYIILTTPYDCPTYEERIENDKIFGGYSVIKTFVSRDENQCNSTCSPWIQSQRAKGYDMNILSTNIVCGIPTIVIFNREHKSHKIAQKIAFNINLKGELTSVTKEQANELGCDYEIKEMFESAVITPSPRRLVFPVGAMSCYLVTRDKEHGKARVDVTGSSYNIVYRDGVLVY